MSAWGAPSASTLAQATASPARGETWVRVRVRVRARVRARARVRVRVRGRVSRSSRSGGYRGAPR